MKHNIKKQIIATIMVVVLILFLYNYYFSDYWFTNNLSSKEKDWLERKETLIYAADKNAPPLRFIDDSDEQYKGVLIDYVNSLSLELGIKIELHPMLWEDALTSLALGETDMCDMFASKERSKDYLFSKPIYNLRAVLAVNSESKDINSLEDVEGQAMAMQKGDYASEYLTINYPNIHQIHVDDLNEALKLVRDGKAVGTLGDEPVMLYNIDKESLGESIRIIENPVYENQVVFSVPKSEPELVSILNKGIDRLSKKNVLEKIQQKWFGISAAFVKESNVEKIKNYMVIFIGLFLLIFTLFGVWNRSLKNQIDIRTKELMKSRNDLQIVFDGMNGYMMVLNNLGEILNINKALLDFLNIKSEDAIGEYFRKHLVEFGSDDFYSFIKASYEKQIYGSFELYSKNQVYEVNTYPLKDDEESNWRTLVLIYDVTGERISKNNLLQANKMVAIGQLAAGIGHEIRNPLGIIRSHVYIIKSLNNLDPAISKSMDYIESAVTSGSKIINNLLNFSRISGLSKENINISVFIHDIIELQNKFTQDKNITYLIECEKNLNFYTNQESLKHILINLISNAIDAIIEEGTITINAYKENKDLIIQCIDSGTGISEEDIEKIYNPFYTTKELGKGTGLGLYIVFSEIEKLNGRISASSSMGVGTKFEVVIPDNREVGDDDQ